MKLNIKVSILIESVETTSYGQNTRTVTDFDKKISQELTARQAKEKLNEILADATNEVAHCFVAMKVAEDKARLEAESKDENKI